jgi:hypothetical protein
MPKVVCYPAEVNLYSSLPAVDQALEIQGVASQDYFAKASTDSNGAPTIELSFDWSRRDVIPASADYGMDDWHLQDALQRLLGSAPTAGAAAIGLIFANFYSSATGVYGYMFDANLHSATLGPRQGCAVFLHEIFNATGADPSAFQNRVVYTAIHEIGHVFNLWHIDNPASFMKPPPNDDFLAACSFINDHQHYLGCAGNPEEMSFVLPGPLASDFGTRVAGYSTDQNGFFAVSPVAPLTLNIALSHEKFWSFEPLELEVELGVTGPAGTSVTIPNEIDPGYARFEVWITQPDGERRRYRPERRFCSNTGTLKISLEMPFRRDMPIALQSGGGWAFTMAGRHKVQVILRLNARKRVVSNIVECEVLRSQPDQPDYQLAYDALARRAGASLVHYRSRLPATTQLVKVRQFADEQFKSASAASVHYSLGAVFLRRASATGDIEHARFLTEQGLGHLRRLQGHPALSAHRASKIAGMLAAETSRNPVTRNT